MKSVFADRIIRILYVKKQSNKSIEDGKRRGGQRKIFFEIIKYKAEKKGIIWRKTNRKKEE